MKTRFSGTLRLAPLVGLFTVCLLGAFTLAQETDPGARVQSRGEEVFNTVCATCHSLRPPAKTAPPMLMVVQHYFEAHETPERVKSAMSSWIPNPDLEKTSMPAHAVEKFGLMPGLALPNDDIEAVVDYLLELYGQEDMAAMHPAGQTQTGQGRGMMMRRGMQMNADTMNADTMQTGMQIGGGMMMRHGMQMNADTTQTGMQMGGGRMMRRGMQMNADTTQTGMQMGGGRMMRHGMQMNADTTQSSMQIGGGMMMRRGMQAGSGSAGMSCPMHNQRMGMGGGSN